MSFFQTLGFSKPVRIALTFALLFVGSVGFYACQQKDVASEGVKPASRTTREGKTTLVNPYAIYGLIHNASLTHMKDYTLPANISSIQEKVDVMKDELSSFVLNNYQLSQDEQASFVNALNEHKNYLHTPQFTNDFLRNYSDNEAKLLELKEGNLLDGVEYQLVKRLLQISKQGSENTISFTEFSNVIDSVQTVYQAQNYPTDMSRGAFAGVIISITTSSRDWWVANQDALPTNVSIQSATSKDIKGAIGGALINGSGQLVGLAIGFVTKFNPYMFCWSVVGGAILASSGVLEGW